MKSKIFFTALAATTIVNTVNAATLTPGGTCPSVSGWYIYKCSCSNDGRHSQCSYNTVAIGHTTCYISSADGGDGDNCTWICAKDKNADPCTVCDCPQTTDWIFDEEYAERNIYNNTTTAYTCTHVSHSTEHGCAAGYYKTVPYDCIKCPSSGGISGTNEIGTGDITTCHIPSGSAFSDGTGTGTYTGNCFYKN